MGPDNDAYTYDFNYFYMAPRNSLEHYRERLLRKEDNMTTNFKPGDKIIMKPGAESLFGHPVGGLAGTITHLDPQPERGCSLYVEFPDLSGSKLVRPEDVLTVNNGYTDAQIHKALAKVKADNNYCSEFDEAVQTAQFMPLLDRLKIIANEKGQPGVYAKLEKTLAEMNKPYEMPEIPVKGETVKVTFLDGTSYTGEVTDDPYVDFDLGEGFTKFIMKGRTHVVYVSDRYGDSFPQRRAVTIEKVIPIPEIGRWIEATDAEGNTKTIEVTRAYDLGSVTEISGSWIFPNNARIDKPGIGWVSTSRGRIVSWKYTTKPWAVGNVVPAGVKVGKDWFGERKDGESYHLRKQIDKDEHSSFQRVILWIED